MFRPKTIGWFGGVLCALGGVLFVYVSYFMPAYWGASGGGLSGLGAGLMVLAAMGLGGLGIMLWIVAFGLVLARRSRRDEAPPDR